jgi:serine/threonine protein kinase
MIEIKGTFPSSLGHLVGRGAFGRVHALPRSVRVMKLVASDAGGLCESAIREILIHALVSQEPNHNIVPLLTVHHKTGSVRSIGLVFPHMGCTLDEAAAQVRVVPRPIITRVVRQIGAALSHIHRLGVVHGDVKPENVLLGSGQSHLDGRCSVFLCDFGLSVAAYQECAVLYTKPYRPPEMDEDGGTATPACDVWALGWLAAELCTRPYQRLPAPIVLSEEQREFVWQLAPALRAMLRVRPEKRVSARAVAEMRSIDELFDGGEPLSPRAPVDERIYRPAPPPLPLCVRSHLHLVDSRASLWEELAPTIHKFEALARLDDDSDAELSAFAACALAFKRRYMRGTLAWFYPKRLDRASCVKRELHILSRLLMVK